MLNPLAKLGEGFVPLAKPFPRKIDHLGNLAQPLFAAINGANAPTLLNDLAIAPSI
ncbi:hypothetical protein H6G00_11250 [Leptolyngbya sp. FACHB-541]|uniref:hypothetical protein n=1 Tax=Leptolyngbya sp. FACHB-541 TaxID=2692810 RepID=UPI001687E524|nr:hypothetical protein [Leptolyngbya sp. FACHB-541]MBD1997195.1 hypothetical protein [Leptolyngbya sp. FACHB-541]